MSKQPASTSIPKPTKEAPKKATPVSAGKVEDPAVMAFVRKMRLYYKRVLEEKGKDVAKKLESRITAVIRDFQRESHSDDDGGFDFRFE